MGSVGVTQTKTAPGLVNKVSRYSVDETVTRLERVLASHHVHVFARIDHAAEARKVGMNMRPAQLLIFGSPRSGTPLMQSSPLVAIDLPLKILVWQDESSKVRVTYNVPQYLQDRYALSSEVIKSIGDIGVLVEEAFSETEAPRVARANSPAAG